MIQHSPISTLTDTLCPCTTLFRSLIEVFRVGPVGDSQLDWVLVDVFTSRGAETNPVSRRLQVFLGRSFVEQSKIVADLRRVRLIWLRIDFRSLSFDKVDIVIDGFRIGSRLVRSEKHTYELQSLMSISYAVFCLHKKSTKRQTPVKYCTKNTTNNNT